VTEVVAAKQALPIERLFLQLIVEGRRDALWTLLTHKTTFSRRFTLPNFEHPFTSAQRFEERTQNEKKWDNSGIPADFSNVGFRQKPTLARSATLAH
jgi:hypothetical protein